MSECVREWVSGWACVLLGIITCIPLHSVPLKRNVALTRVVDYEWIKKIAN